MRFIREQIVEDLPSGLTLQFETFEGGVRLTIASKALPTSREIAFDTEGAASKTGPSKRAFRRHPGCIEGALKILHL